MTNNMKEGLLSLEAEGATDLKRRIWEESKKTWRIAFPTIVARVTTFGTLVVTQSFVGHITEFDLTAYALSQTILIRLAYGILLGMGSATETLCGQAFGAKQYHMMGIYLQRSWIVDAVVATMLTPLFIFATPLFKLLGQEEEVAIAAGSVSLWFIPILYCFVFTLTIQMYLQAQLKNMIVGWLSASSFMLHVLLSWIFVIKLNLGVPGAMWSMIISMWSMVIGELVYIFGGWCSETWGGFKTAAFTDILPMVKLSLASGIMQCLELWYYAIVLLLAGYLKNASVALSAFSICINIYTWELMLALGLQAAASVRVSNELGAGNARAVKFSVLLILSTSTVVGIFFWILCLVLGHDIAYLFTSNEKVAETVSSLSILLAFSILFNSVQPILLGVAIGAGWQKEVAFVNLGCYYVIGVPFGTLLAYVAGLSVRGMWIGMIVGVGMQTLALIYITWRTKWDTEVEKASEHLGRWFLESSEE